MLPFIVIYCILNSTDCYRRMTVGVVLFCTQLNLPKLVKMVILAG